MSAWPLHVHRQIDDFSIMEHAVPEVGFPFLDHFNLFEHPSCLTEVCYDWLKTIAHVQGALLSHTLHVDESILLPLGD